jgi:NADH-quinone oxidoreductase subunit M
MRLAGSGIFDMNLGFEELLLLASIVVPTAVSLCLFTGLVTSDEAAKKLAYVGFGVPFVAGVLLFLWFEGAVGADYKYEVLFDRTGLQELGITFHLGLNGVSSPLFAMAGFVGLAAGLAAIHSGAERIRLYLALLTLMQAGLMGFFASVDLFFYFLFHEFALVPTFIMIGLWGGRDRRSVALEITIYLTLGALIVLGGLVALNVMGDAEKFDFPTLAHLLSTTPLGESAQFKIFGLLLLGFGILVALFPFHTWAPRAYSAAPTSVSMLHAGVLKKFGLYGLVQVAVPLLPSGAAQWSDFLIWLALGNVLFVGLVTMAQNNLKSMVGYGSVMHMGYCFLGVATCSALGAGSVVMLMTAHGLSVALMFLVGTFVYRRCGTFEMDEMGGLGTKTPVLACFFLAAVLATIGLPGFGNFWGEFGIFMSLGENPGTRFALVLAVLGIIISAIFGLRAVAKVFFGEQTEEFAEFEKANPVKDLNLVELLPAGLLVAALLLLGLWPRTISDRVNAEIGNRYQAFESSVPGSLPACCAITTDEPEVKEGIETNGTAVEDTYESSKPKAGDHD